MKYKVIEDFIDLTDNNYSYKAGDEYPRTITPSEERITALSTSENKAHRPLIKAIKRKAESNGGNSKKR